MQSSITNHRVKNEVRPWVVEQTYKASKLAFSDINRNRRLYISSQVKSALRNVSQKLREGKDRDCVFFMSDVCVLYKSCVAHLDKWTNLFAEFKCFDEIAPFANNRMGKCEQYLIERNVSVDEASPFGQHQNLSSCKQSIIQMQFIVK